MTEITRVPLQPIKKGSLTKLWLGVAVAVLLGAGLAWAAIPKGLDVETVTAGTGDSPKMGDVVFVKYVGKLADGTEFDRSQPLPIPPGLFPEGNPLLLEEGAIIDGFIEGLTQMQKGGSYVLTIPAEQAYFADPAQCRSDLRCRSRRFHEPGRFPGPCQCAPTDDGPAAAGPAGRTRPAGAAARRITDTGEVA